jgi:hypothetical protein
VRLGLVSLCRRRVGHSDGGIVRVLGIGESADAIKTNYIISPRVQLDPAPTDARFTPASALTLTSSATLVAMVKNLMALKHHYIIPTTRT